MTRWKLIDRDCDRGRRRRGRLPSAAATDGTTRAAASSKQLLPPVGHVFVINLENKGYTKTFGPASATDPYLSQTLTSEGVLLSEYYGIGHESNDNYLAQISGQGPNLPKPRRTARTSSTSPGPALRRPGQAVGQGCVYPTSVSHRGQPAGGRGLDVEGLHGGHGQHPEPGGGPCGHPALNTQDQTQTAVVGDQYATRHDPFVYFHSIIDTPGVRQRRGRPLTSLPADLQSVEDHAQPHLHHAQPVRRRPRQPVRRRPARRAGLGRRLAAAPGCRRSWPRPPTSTTACSSSPSTSPMARSRTPRPAAARDRARTRRCRASPASAAAWSAPWSCRAGCGPGSSNNTGYNHYSLLATIEALFGLSRLGYAADRLTVRAGRLHGLPAVLTATAWTSRTATGCASARRSGSTPVTGD